MFIYIVYFAIKCSTKRQNDKTNKVKTTTIYTLYVNDVIILVTLLNAARIE